MSDDDKNCNALERPKRASTGLYVRAAPGLKLRDRKVTRLGRKGSRGYAVAGTGGRANCAGVVRARIRLSISRAVALETSRGWRIAKEKVSHKIDVVVALAQAALGAERLNELEDKRRGVIHQTTVSSGSVPAGSVAPSMGAFALRILGR